MRPRALLLLVLVATLGGSPARAEAPGNDSFADASDLTTLPATVHADTTEATTEAYEPQPSCAGIGQTVWYRYTAGSNQMVSFDTKASPYDFNTVIAIWRGGSLADLSELACNDRRYASEQAAITVGIHTGETVFVQVGGFNFHKPFTLGQPAQPDPFSDTGALTLDVSPSTDPLRFRPPPNDDRADALAIDGLPFGDHQFTDAASVPAGERRDCPDESALGPVTELTSVSNGSVWYSFEPAEDGAVSIDASGYSQDIFIEVSRLAGDELVPLRCEMSPGFYGLAHLTMLAEVSASETYLFRVSTDHSGIDGLMYPTYLVFDVPPTADGAVRNLTVGPAGSGVEQHREEIDFDVVSLWGDWAGRYIVEACPGPTAHPIGECDVIGSGFVPSNGHVHVPWTPLAIGTVTVIARTHSDWIHDIAPWNNSASVTTTIGPSGEAGAVVPCLDPYEWGYVCPV